MKLPGQPTVSAEWKAALANVIERTRQHPPRDLAAIVRDELGIDLSARYGGVTLPHPFGKASGQLSHQLHQVEADVASGVAFIVLKTVIAEDASGARTMDEWATVESRMKVEPVMSQRGRDGWTVTWRGRGWGGSLNDYLEFFEQSLGLGNTHDVPVIPSVKYHIPLGNESLRGVEYEFTTHQLLSVWERAGCGGDMLLEKDLSPTLAGDPRATEQDRILEWLARMPSVIARAASGRIRLGVKVMNALFDDRFQLDMLRALIERAERQPDFLVVFNRLYDAKRSIAYGGWDLSDRNLRVLDMARAELGTLPPLSGTGNISTGRMMAEYAMRGCENGQLHTFFQLPLSEYTATGGSRAARALYTLLLHPEQGLVVWLRHLYEAGVLDAVGGEVRFLDLVRFER